MLAFQSSYSLIFHLCVRIFGAAFLQSQIELLALISKISKRLELIFFPRYDAYLFHLFILLNLIAAMQEIIFCYYNSFSESQRAAIFCYFDCSCLMH
jgi:hypothetical protein